LVFQRLDSEGNFKESGELTKQFMHSLGFEETAAISPAFHYKKDLREYASTAELVGSYTPKTRSEIRNAQNNCLNIRALDKTELVVFEKILQATGQRQGFTARSLEYYEAFYEAFVAPNTSLTNAEELETAQFLVVEVDFAKLSAQLEAKKAQLSNRIEEYSKHPKKAGAKKELENQLSAVEAKLEKYQRDLAGGQTLPICAGLFICSNDEMVYLFGGSLTEYMDLKAVYFLVADQLKSAHERGLSSFNFYGVGPNFSKTAPEYGVLAFKQGFGGYIDELIGQWVLPL
jgi:alanine adding enzyme